ncbi:hypothetical protein [Carnobacterium maltaromaticum]|uniref:hypothetical protein n=1 Tax=Carnobacterium maltaromaticum TaxID=2751 RepID=UPI00295F2918|nr:hypothetical protein [Carnobacterium maltaromaticum]
MTSKREHEMAIAVAQTLLSKELDDELRDSGLIIYDAGVSAASFATYYETALDQFENDYPDTNSI